MKKIPKLSTIMIAAGGLLVVLALASELIMYPWFPKESESQLPDPPPPLVDFISFSEYISMSEINGPTERVTEFYILPGEDIVLLPGEMGEPVPTGSLQNQSAVEASGEPEVPIPVLPRYVLMGSVKIPRINISENLFMGTDTQINHGIGHLTGTPLPGEAGNSVIAGHRTARSGMQPFRHLDLMREGDIIVVDVNGEAFIYTVYESFIVREDDIWVLREVQDETHVLTLVTCDPVVSMTQRYNRLIVRARLAEK
jgi:LPXTG-site transpeptidase (sortase) family protein